ncbi:MAG: TPM domain-containing protein [Selenomonadaceae bacterium]|nr:TPM domain-containing protein [Selenomonadaceae bacterium]
MLKKFFGLVAIIFALNFSVSSAALQPVTDKAALLSAQEVDMLNNKIRDIQLAHKIKIGVVFAKSLGGRDIVTASNELLDKNFANGVNGGIILLVDMGSRKFEIATRGQMVQSITDYDGIPFLKKKFTSSLSAGDYSGAANNFVDGVDELVTYYETNGKAYGAQEPGGFDPMAAVGAVIVALFCGVTIRSWLIGSMSNIRHAREATDYLKRDTVKLTENRDMFLFRNVSRRPRSSGGKGGTGGGSHGGGHGGGGGSF